MVKPIPDDIKTTLGELSSSQQVVVRGYIATLRAEIKELEEQLNTTNDPDPHAHYHGHEKCTADHNHGDHGHDSKDHGTHDHKVDHQEHKHEHTHDSKTDCKHESHGHEHAAKSDHNHGHEHAAKSDHNHGHEHAAKSDDHHGHDHACEDEGHSHKHAHGDHKEEIPAWKKKAMDADPNAAPFGGSWNTESNITATAAAQKMDES